MLGALLRGVSTREYRIDGQRFGAHHILSALGVDVEGNKHIMGIAAGATENAAAVVGVAHAATGSRAAHGPEIPVCH